MALISRAQAKPGFAQASQTPFAIGPGGGSGFGDLLSRQFALREQMQQAQLAQMQQDLLFQKQNQMRQGDIYGKSRMVKGGLTAGPGMDPTRAKAYDMARELSRTHIGSLAVTPNLERMISAIGGPQAAHQGMMQSGQILGQLGGAAIGAGAQLGSNQMRSEAMRYQADKRAQTALQLQGMENQQLAGQPGQPSGSQFPQLMILPDGTVRMTGDNSFVGPPTPPPARPSAAPITRTPSGGYTNVQQGMEKGGRVPSTGTYKLHKGEVVVPRKASDVMFPYAGGGPKASKGKPRKSYQDGTIEFLKNFKLPENMTKKEALDIIKFLKSYTPPPQYSAGGGEMGLNLAGDPGPGIQGGFYGGGGFGGTGAGGPFGPPEGKREDESWREYVGRTAAGWLRSGTGAMDRALGVPSASLPPIQPPPPIDIAAAESQNYGLPQPTPGVEMGAPAFETAPLQAPPSAGGITYEGPGLGGMTKFGVPGKLPGGPFEAGESLGTVSQMSDQQFDITNMHRMENEATIADRSAQIAEQRGDRLERYLNEQSTPNRELVAMIKENDRAAQRWRTRSKELRGQADKLRSIDVAKQLQEIEAAGVEGAARWKAMGEAGKDQLQNFDANYEALNARITAAYKNYEDDSNEQRFRVDIMRAFAPLLSRLQIRHPEGSPKAGKLMDANEMSAWFDQFTMDLVNGKSIAKDQLTQLMKYLADRRLS